PSPLRVVEAPAVRCRDVEPVTARVVDPLDANHPPDILDVAPADHGNRISLHDSVQRLEGRPWGRGSGWIAHDGGERSVVVEKEGDRPGLQADGALWRQGGWKMPDPPLRPIRSPRGPVRGRGLVRGHQRGAALFQGPR